MYIDTFDNAAYTVAGLEDAHEGHSGYITYMGWQSNENRY